MLYQFNAWSLPQQQLGRSLLVARLLAWSDADGFVPLCSRVFNCHGRGIRVVAEVVTC